MTMLISKLSLKLSHVFLKAKDIGPMGKVNIRTLRRYPKAAEIVAGI